MANPYANVDFLGFLALLYQRLKERLMGLPLQPELASDELQLFTLLLIAFSSALLGSLLVLKKMTMLANSLSHTILVGIVIVFYLVPSVEGRDLPLNALLLASLGMAFFTSFLTQFLTASWRLQEDASTGLVFTSLFALGILLVTAFTRSSHIGIEVVMGNVDNLQGEDLQLVFCVALINLALTLLLFKEYKILCFDEAFAKICRLPVGALSYLLMAQVALSAVGAFRAVGVILYLAFITAPALSASLLTHRLKTLMLLAVAFGSVSSLLAVATARHLLTVYGLALSTSGIAVAYLSLLFLLSGAWRFFFGIFSTLPRRILNELPGNFPR
ncbi:MAG: ABC-type transporter, permease subunit [Chlamydiales bacterium]|jgi:manganese/zinc/iron transport system permease protein|nr:ABC-type transporter, permease subunit [Chlamydiales bacterium]